MSADEAKTAKRGKKGGKKTESTPVPDSMANTNQVGHIDEVVRPMIGGPIRFGFIYIGTDGGDSRPRIYFNISDFQTKDFKPRKKYEVSFKVEKDDTDRFFASNVELTDAGKETASKREAEIAEAKKAEDAEGGGEKKEGAAKAKSGRKRAVDTREVKLKLTAEGFDGEKEVVAKLGESLGKLKHTCITALGTEDITLNVFAGATLLSKELLREMKDGDAITLKALPAATA
jgi:hypothetical protein